MKIVKTIGNDALMQREKTLFLCSKHTPVSLYETVFRWTDSLTERDCIACFNSTEMEAEVVKALLVGRIPVILFVMNRFTDVNNLQIELALKERRMLIVVLQRDEPKGKGSTPRLRNAYVMSLCRQVVCGYVNKNGIVFPLLAERKNVVRLIGDDACNTVAECEELFHRWTVGQDKVLLRMFYEDKGIHAIHKRLRRSHPAVYMRLRSLTMPEAVLKGREFEDFVLQLFHAGRDGLFTLKEWQGDKMSGEVCPENNRHPDFVFSCKEGIFAVECKWRERLGRTMDKDLFPSDKLEIYQQFAAERRMPVYIVLGVGGETCLPDHIYVIPLHELPAVIARRRPLSDFLRVSATMPFAVEEFISDIPCSGDEA